MDYEERIKALEERVTALEDIEKKKKREKIIKYVVGLIFILGFTIGIYLFIKPYIDQLGSLYSGF